MNADARSASACISISEYEILLKVEDLDKQQRAFIAITKDQILSQVDDMARELTGLIDVQAGAVTAMVEGGGATGQMSLSLNLPVMIDAATRAKFVQASSEADVSAVYAQLAGTDGENIKYAIKSNASNAAVKALWDKAVAAALIASQIDLSATQINVAAENVVITGSTNKGQTIIEGGYLRTALIEVDNMLTKNITIKDKGVIHSDNYNGTIDANGNITGYGSAGWAIDHSGKSDFSSINAQGSFSCSEISIAGIQPGDIKLRTIKTTTVGTGEKLTATTQIIGTGTVRLKIKGNYIGISSGSSSGSLGADINAIYGNTQQLLGQVDHVKGTVPFEYEADVPVSEGEYVGFKIDSYGGGVVGGPKIEITDAGVYTKTNQGVLSYLGDYGTTNKTGGGGR